MTGENNASETGLQVHNWRLPVVTQFLIRAQKRSKIDVGEQKEKKKQPLELSIWYNARYHGFDHNKNFLFCHFQS